MNQVQVKEQFEGVKALWATEAHPDVSSKYSFVSTAEMIESFGKLGWYPTKASQVKSRKKDPMFAKHMIRFRNDSIAERDGIVPELIMDNSHDRSTGIAFDLGLFRVVCSNGLRVRVPNSINMAFRQRHMKVDIDALREFVRHMLEQFEVVYAQIEQMKSTVLNSTQQLEFAKNTVDLVYNERADKFELQQFLVAKRVEDEANDVWTVLNRIQEHMMRGGMVYSTKKGTKHSRAVKSISRDKQINLVIWGMVSNYLQNGSFK